MAIFNTWYFYVLVFLVSSVFSNHFFKVATKSMTKPGSLTVLLELLGGIFVLLFLPFFSFEFPSDIKVYLLLLASCIFYALTDRMGTVVRSNIEASTYSILKRISTVFLIISGIVLFKEPLVLTKIIGAILIIISNVLVFYKKGDLKYNKYIFLGILANLTVTIAVLLDINISESFNLSFYVAMTLLIPALLIIIFERIRYKSIKEEYVKGNKKAIFLTAFSWGMLLLSSLRAYQLGEVSVIAPLCAVATILNVFAGYIFLKERNRLLIKVIAAILIVLGIFLIKL